jgi:hypothetical protein
MQVGWWHDTRWGHAACERAWASLTYFGMLVGCTGICSVCHLVVLVSFGMQALLESLRGGCDGFFSAQATRLRRQRRRRRGDKKQQGRQQHDPRQHTAAPTRYSTAVSTLLYHVRLVLYSVLTSYRVHVSLRMHAGVSLGAISGIKPVDGVIARWRAHWPCVCVGISCIVLHCRLQHAALPRPPERTDGQG